MKNAVAMGPDDYPVHMDIKSSQLPAIKNWKVGKTYRVIATVKMTGLHEGYGEKKNTLRGDFEVQKVESAGEIKGAKDETETSKAKTSPRSERIGGVAKRALADDDSDD